MSEARGLKGTYLLRAGCRQVHSRSRDGAHLASGSDGKLAAHRVSARANTVLGTGTPANQPVPGIPTLTIICIKNKLTRINSIKS